MVLMETFSWDWPAVQLLPVPLFIFFLFKNGINNRYHSLSTDCVLSTKYTYFTYIVLFDHHNNLMRFSFHIIGTRLKKVNIIWPKSVVFQTVSH